MDKLVAAIVSMSTAGSGDELLNRKFYDKSRRISVSRFIRYLLGAEEGMVIGDTSKYKYFTKLFPNISTEGGYTYIRAILEQCEHYQCELCLKVKNKKDTKSRVDKRNVCYRCLRKENSTL